MDLRQFPQNPKALLIEAKDKIIALEAQLAEANEKLDKYAGMCLSCPDMGMTLVVERLEQELAEANEAARLQRANKRIAELEAQCAAMREALLLMPEICELAADEAVYTYREIHEQAVKKEIELNELIEKVEAALASDAGRELLERLAKAEAERVTPLNREQLWQYVFVNTGVGVDELDGIIGHLILNDHIREAE